VVKKNVQQKMNKLTDLCQIIVGGGLPLDSHSKVMVEPFRTTNFPSRGKGCTLGGTASKKQIFIKIKIQNRKRKYFCLLPFPAR
jgi:hypothetical protein